MNLIPYLSIALFVLFGAALVFGALLAWRNRGRWRIIGVLLALQALLAIIVQAVLSTIPFGLGEPMIALNAAPLLRGILAVLVAGVLGIAAWWLGRRAMIRLSGTARERAWTAGLLLLVPLVAAPTLYGLVQLSTPDRVRERDPYKRTIELPVGFRADIFAQGTMDNPTAIAFGPDGQAYVTDIGGTVWVLPDANSDYQADAIRPWADGLEFLVGAAWRNDELFVAVQGAVLALRDSDKDGRADQRRTVVDGLPSMVLVPHTNNAVQFGPDGRLYFGVGSTTNGQIEQNELAASVLSVNPDGSDLKVFARGFSNTFGIAFTPDGQLFGSDNGPGGEADLPDEFNHIVEGGFYGYPYFYGDPSDATGATGALATFPPHSSPTGMTFYTGQQFPEEFQGNGLVALWNTGELARIELAKTPGGRYLSRTSTFASGFVYPLAAVTAPDGSLYVADFGTSTIYRITYQR